MQASYDVSRFTSARFKARLSIAGQSGAPRLREISGVSKLLEQGVASARSMRVGAPPDMRGVGTLTIDRKGGPDDLWVYLPSLKKVRRLVATNRRDPWIGSDFSYGDIVGHEVADWSHRIERREPVGGVDCLVVESLPIRKGLAQETGYSKRVSWLRESDFLAMRVAFFDLSGAALKTMQASDIRLIDKAAGKSQAMTITMQAARSLSTLTFSEFRIDADVSDDEIAPGALSR
jgi:hypothetical protein